MVGTYTGGSVNLAAMADAYHVKGDMVSAAVVADNLLMVLYFFVLIAVSGSKFFLKTFRHPLIDEARARTGGEKEDGGARNNGSASLTDIAVSISLALAIAAVSGNLADLLGDVIPTGNFAMDLLHGLLSSRYLIITTLTIVISTLFSDTVGNLGGAQELGTYLIHIFFAVIGAPASVYLILTKAPILLLFCAIIVLTNMFCSFAAGRLLGFSLEETVIASNANIGGPTTAAAMAVAKGWDPLILPAILVGTLGYVLGNYYGILVGTIAGL